MTQIVKDVECNQTSEPKTYFFHFLDFSKINFSETLKMKFQWCPPPWIQIRPGV